MKKRLNTKVEKTDYKVLLINFILVLFIAFGGYRYYFSYIYNVDNDTATLRQNISTNVLFNQQHTYSMGSTKANSINFKNLYISSLYTNYSVVSESDTQGVYTLNSGSDEVTMTINIFNNFMGDILEEYPKEVSLTYKELVMKENQKQVVANYLHENEIYNEVDLINAFEKSIATNILNSMDELQMNYSIGYLIESTLNLGATNLINGDCQGYITKISTNTIMIVLIKDGINYTISYTGDYEFDTNEKIFDIIDTIVIK
ncbi:MAG: hypothetical protein R3Y13_00145 [bacterium]